MVVEINYKSSHLTLNKLFKLNSLFCFKIVEDIKLL